MFCLECGTELPDETSTCTQCGWELASTTPMAAATPPSRDEKAAVAEALAGEYEVVEELGRGGMAIVYRGREISLDREVAIKVLPFTFAFDNDFVERFQREARTAARLEHPHIIPIHRVGREGNVIYFTMKFLRGESLARILATRAALHPAEIRTLLIEAGGALGYAHQHGVVHRDIKPDNIMFTETGHSVVCDFGIAKAASESKLTGTGTAIGTPHYMSPEQARAQPLDGRSDLYSLGVVAYKCLTGKVPFDAEDSYAIGIKHITEPLPSPGLETDEQRLLFPIVEQLLEKAPDDRFETAEAMIEALQALPLGTGASVPVSMSSPQRSVTPPPPSAVEATEVSVPGGLTETPTTPMPRSAAQTAVSTQSPAPDKKSKAPVLVGALALLVGIGGGYVVLNRGGDGPTSALTSPPPVATADTTQADNTAGPPELATNPPAAQEQDGEPPARGPQPLTESELATPPPTRPQPRTTPPPRTAEPEPEPEPARVQPPIDTVFQAPPAVDSTPAQTPPARDQPARNVRDAIVDSVRARAEERGIGRLELRGLRNGSALFIGDRRRRGLGHQLPAGEYLIRVEHPDFLPYSRTITVTAGQITRLVVEQERRN